MIVYTTSMAVVLQLTPELQAIQARSTIVKSVRLAVTEAFGEQLPFLRGNIALVTEVLIIIESMKFGLKTDEEKTALFFDVYNALFGQMQDIEKTLLTQIVQHLRESGAIFKRSRIGDFVRWVLRAFRP